MKADFQSADATARLQALQPRFQLRKAVIFIVAFVFLFVISFVWHGPERFFYRGLAVFGAFAMAVQYRRERGLVHNHLSAVGVVTDYRIPGRSRYRVVRFFVARFAPEVPVIKYSFTAFDQKTYSGETGFGARDLHKGDMLFIIYNPENPARNHPLGGFIFHSFE